MPSQTLTLSQMQSLQQVLAPQLRQSLEMLQVPMLELRAMIQKELEQNPTLEEGEPEPTAETPAATTAEPGVESGEDPASGEEFDKEFDAISKLDEEWRDYFHQNAQSTPYSKDDAERRQFMLDSIPQMESLQEHLLTQLSLSDLSPDDKQIAELIIGNINDDGYLTSPLEEMAQSAGCDPKHVEDVLTIVQDFHPVGIGARDLKECLLLQLERIGHSSTLAVELIKEHLDQLGAKKYHDIARTLKVSPEEVQQAAHLIATLDPKPGSVFSADSPTYVTPEVVIQKVDGEYVILMNDDQLPHIRISNYYRDLLGDPDVKRDVKSYVRERIRSGAFLIKSIHQRQATIYRIATEIVKTQRDFLDSGIAHLRPLTMAAVARIIGVHETTVSRAVAGKYMKTPDGLYEMKFFFTPGIMTADGTQISNKAVQDTIAGMVAAEDFDHPLSDQEIMERLKAQGITIARRTIAKYRIALKIPPSHLRKSY